MKNGKKHGFRIAVAVVVCTLACNLPGTLATSAPNPSPVVSAAPPTVTEWQLTVDELLARCPSAAEIAEINAKITLSFESDPTAGTLVCRATGGSADLTRLQKNAYNAIVIMKYLKFDTPLPWTDQPLYDWFLGTISAIRFRSDIASHFCCGTPPTINIKTELHALYSDRWTAVGALTKLYVHEARHTFKAHDCNGLDMTISEMGAMGVEYLFFHWLAYHSDPDFLTTLDPGPTADYRQAARWNAFAMSKYDFCAEPTPSVLPPPLTPSRFAATPVVTDRMAAAFNSGVPVPVLVSPAADATVPVQGVQFTWEPVDFPGGVTYGIEIDTFWRFGTDWHYWDANADETGLANPSYDLPIRFDGNYSTRGRWRVWAVSPAAGPGPRSEWRYFEIKAP